MTRLIRHSLKFRKRGVGAIEVAISAGLMILIVGLAVDLTILNYAFSVNDAACRDAARAAAGCEYATSASGIPDAVDSAKAALTMHLTDGYFISQPTLVSTTTPNFFYDNNASGPAWTNYPAPKTFTVTVTTSVNVRLPVPLFFWGNSFTATAQSQGLANGSGQLVFTRRYQFPIIRAGIPAG
jgi:Flp pilus assembly protein TadG